MLGVWGIERSWLKRVVMFCPLASTIQALGIMFNFGSVGWSWFKRLILMCPGTGSGLGFRVDDLGLRELMI